MVTSHWFKFNLLSICPPERYHKLLTKSVQGKNATEYIREKMAYWYNNILTLHGDKILAAIYVKTKTVALL